MLTTIKGTYTNGQIVLDEMPPTKKKLKVVVTFLEEVQGSSQKRKLGSLKGKIGIPDDFNEPLDDLKDYMYRYNICWIRKYSFGLWKIIQNSKNLCAA